MTEQFKEFSKIENIGKLYMSITQKMHGTNAQINITKDVYGLWQVQAGSRSRWLSPGKHTDNFGFAQWVRDNQCALINTLGEGRHYAEWCGPGINSGEGLSEKTLFLFDWAKVNKNMCELGPVFPKNMFAVPVLYVGKFDFNEIDLAMQFLKINGSRAVNGFMQTEGIVIQVGSTFYKKVFVAEETGWKNQIKKQKNDNQYCDVNHLLQPIRLEKLLSRDQQYILNYPVSLPNICKDYVADLCSEMEITQEQKKSIGNKIFPFVKEIIKSMSNISLPPF